MSYRTNRRTGGTFRTTDYTPSELQSQSRRFICPTCAATFGEDITPSVAATEASMTGHEVAGTPLTSFLTRAELNQHIKEMHGGKRFPTKAHRQLGRPKKRKIVKDTTIDDEPFSVDEDKDTVFQEDSILGGDETVNGEGDQLIEDTKEKDMGFFP